MRAATTSPSWDIFCAVIDNYGDIGVCWRLARQLAGEHGFAVRLWVDDLASFACLCPRADVSAGALSIEGVEVRHWHKPFPADVEPADVVIEAFACELPDGYLAAMAARARRPVWLNLEYLSAEAWVEDCHAVASPHPRLPLVKHFFFPGFTSRTGGLLRERDLFARRDAFVADAAAIARFWADAGFAPPPAGALCVSLFAYPSADVPALLRAFADCGRSVVCAIPDGPLLEQAARLCGGAPLRTGDEVLLGSLTLRALPFVAQPRYDEVLWASDLNFVRGEDSFVRAQWAARPFVWHIYPQADAAHRKKLEAFEARYCAGLPPPAREALRGLWQAWNGGSDIADCWGAYLAALPALQEHARNWAQELAQQADLASRLADFSANRIE